MNKLILVLIFTLTLGATALAQSNFTDNNFVITTYYPAPYGVYRNMRLNPSDLPTNGVDRGVMYYNDTEDMMKFYNGSTWLNMTAGGGGGEGYWNKSGNDIYNNNTGKVGIGTATPAQKLDVAGNITASGDICAGGVCLSALGCKNVTGDSQTTNWGTNQFNCQGANRRCYQGECKACGGWMNGGYCWYIGEWGRSPAITCSARGGVYNGNCDWVNDPSDCTTCNHFGWPDIPAWSNFACQGAIATGPQSSIIAVPTGGKVVCYYHADGSNECDLDFQVAAFRSAACNY